MQNKNTLHAKSTEDTIGAPEKMHPVAAMARSAVMLDAMLTLA